MGKPNVKPFVLNGTVKIIVDASNRLKCSVRSRCKALILFHQFRRCVPEMKYDPYLLAAACISLSVKSYRENIEFDAILMTFIYMVRNSPASIIDPYFEQMKSSLFFMECIVLRMLNITLKHRLVHEFLVYFLFDINQELKAMDVWDVTNETCMKIASDFYLSDKCLNYSPEEIASCAIEVSLYMTGIDVQESPVLKTWVKNIKESTRKMDIFEDIYKTCAIGPVAVAQN